MKKILSILKSLKTKINICFKFITNKGNNDYVQSIRPDQDTSKNINVIKKPSREAIAIIRKLKNEVENNENTCENDINLVDGRKENDNLTIRIQKFIEENRDGEIIPEAPEIESHFNISEKKKRPCMRDLRKIGYLLLRGKKYYYNLNYRRDESERYN